jgi:RNA polymerase sigma factor (sigma-70 family)
LKKPLKGSNKSKAAVPSSSDSQWDSWSLLMVKMQEGDNEAYRQFLNEVGPVLYHFVKKRVFRPDLVQDVYQEVLLTFHKARHSYEPGRPLGPWLFTVARNSLLTALGKNRKFVEREVPTEKLPDVAPAEKDLSLEDDLQEALKSLPTIYRRAVEILKIQGLSLEDGARELNISVGALKVRAHRGYGQLRKKLLSEKKK